MVPLLIESCVESSLKETMETFDMIKGEIDTIKSRNELISTNQDAINEKMFKIREDINNKNDELHQTIEDRFNAFQVNISDLHNT